MGWRRKDLAAVAQYDLLTGDNLTDLALDVDLIQNLEEGDMEGAAEDIIIRNLFG